ncbi:hypothetical protein JTE90_016038 [Oedothorax gibbosus]|uniref:CWH43-like N-terminal domain-containing protein n=1 Tax=Oedothorax gibbosus TaxID=931172 RepID=A0AAV6VRG9_9ARAC|nr:hypothetical protein JTE90_016038 [Oedothorax gibbosus]
MEWPKVQVSSTKAHTEYKFIGASWYPITMAGAMFATISLPYLIVLARGTLYPFLPFISQVSGSPPMSGIFNLLLIVSSLFAFIGLNLLHMGIRIQKKRLEDDWVRQTASLLNKISLIPGHVGIMGMLIVGSYPIDFYRRTEIWMGVTIIPHLIGALSLFLGGMFYCILITYIMSLLHPEQKQILGIRIFLVSLITMCSALQGYTVREGFMNELVGESIKTCIVEADHLPYNLHYLISSVCEWCLVLAFIVFFTTLKEEARDFCFTMCITIKEDAQEKVTEKKTETVKDVNHNTGASDKTSDKS